MEQLKSYLHPSDVDCIVYHTPCGDGFGGAYVFWKYLKEQKKYTNENINEHIKFIGYSHTTSQSYKKEHILPQLENRNVVFIDVCPDEALFLDMVVNYPKKAIVLYHHTSAVKTLQCIDRTLAVEHSYIDQTHSGAIIAHQYCYPDDPVPMFLQYIEDRDIWAWKLQDTKAFTEAFYKSIPYEFEQYAQFEDEERINQIVKEGSMLIKYTNLRISELVKLATEGTLTIDDKELAVYMINTSEYISELGNTLCKMDCERLQKKCDVAFMWYYDQKAQKIKVSMRSDKDRDRCVDVSELARKFGGGGHKNAAGFTIEQPDLLENAMTKSTQSSTLKFKMATKNVNTKKNIMIFTLGVCIGIGAYYLLQK